MRNMSTPAIRKARPCRLHRTAAVGTRLRHGRAIRRAVGEPGLNSKDGWSLAGSGRRRIVGGSHPGGSRRDHPSRLSAPSVKMLSTSRKTLPSRTISGCARLSTRIERPTLSRELLEGTIIKSRGVHIEVNESPLSDSAFRFRSCRNGLPGRISRAPGLFLR